MNIMQATKHMNEAIPFISRILKKNKFSNEQLREILLNDNKNENFIRFLYSELPTHVRLKIKEDVFVSMYLTESIKSIKNKKNKKKIFKD